MNLQNLSEEVTFETTTVNNTRYTYHWRPQCNGSLRHLYGFQLTCFSLCARGGRVGEGLVEGLTPRVGYK